jgi:hypothetical protein
MPIIKDISMELLFNEIKKRIPTEQLKTAESTEEFNKYIKKTLKLLDMVRNLELAYSALTDTVLDLAEFDKEGENNDHKD